MTDLINAIQALDNKLITAINFDGSPLYNFFWYVYTDKLTWIPLVLAIVYYIMRYSGGWRQFLFFVLVVALLFTLSDQVARGIKYLVERPRPSHNPDIMYQLFYVNDYHGSRYGFPSNHACNGFAAAVFITLLFRRRYVALTAFLWAIGSCYSRMYLGVHYPTDILVGAIIGTALAFVVYFFARAIYLAIGERCGWQPFAESYRKKEPWGIMGVFVMTIIGILVMGIAY